jgi:tetratricopeptide (TPR) repeat protein
MPLEILAAKAAFLNIRSNRNSFWPDSRKAGGDRLGDHATITIRPNFRFGLEDSILTIGSCFAREIEKGLLKLGFDVPMTQVDMPAGEKISATGDSILNKYVPPAMVNELRWAFDPDAFFPELGYLDLGDGLWHDPHLAANLKPAPLARVKERRQQVIDAYRSARKARIVVVTLGLAEAWYDRHTALYLNDRPPEAAIDAQPERFQLHVLSYEEVMRSLEEMLSILRAYGHPEFRILLTVSPVPFKATFTGADALQANMYGKSVLRAAAETFTRRHADVVDYFPSFETVLLGKREVSYHEDNIHVREEVVTRIMEQVVGSYAELEPGGTAAAPNAKTLYKKAKQFGGSNPAAACAQMRRILATCPGDTSVVGTAEFHLNFALWLIADGQPSAGERELRKAMAAGAQDAASQYKVGRVLSRLDRDDEALESFKAASASTPSNAEYLWRLGMQYRRLDRLDEARATLARVLELDANHQGAKTALLELGEAASA